MKSNKATCWATLVISILTAVAPANELVGQEQGTSGPQLQHTASRQTLADVELGQGGLLLGQVVDSVGKPLSNQPVKIQQANQEPIVGRSDQTGRFRISGVKSGACQITAGEYAVACRCWSQRTAPPAATQELLVIIGDMTERGQRPLADLFTGPVLIGMIIGAAIAIPIAIHNSKDDAS